MSTCDNNCTECKEKNNCSLKSTNKFSKIKNVIAVGSGKGGVGKSLVTAILANKFRKDGFKVGILDSDITGPSIPKMFGIKQKAKTRNDRIIPASSKSGIEIISINMFLENDEEAIIWRGPILSNTVSQFWKDTNWGELDYLFIDMPPGTGDIALTIYQSIPVDGLIIVTTPQDLVNLIVKKSFNMAKQMNIPVLGIVENMSYLVCNECSNKIKLFGDSKIDSIASDLKLEVIEKIPLDTKLSEYIDKGNIEDYEIKLFENFKIERGDKYAKI
jgi:Mrp family chromosome partitioning ATPase